MLQQIIQTPVQNSPSIKFLKEEEYLDNPDNPVILRIKLAETYAYVAKISIFDTALERVSLTSIRNDSFLEKVYELNPDIYIIRVEISGRLADTKITLLDDALYTIGNIESNARLNVPELFSAALLGGEINYESSHEYYTEPAKAISSMNTWKGNSNESGLFIFLRFPDENIFREKYKQETYWSQFRLLDGNGRLIVQFPKGCIEDDNSYDWNYIKHSGYIGFSASLKPGIYFLQYAGSYQRIIPMYVYHGWFTQFFMTLANKPLFGSIRIYLSPERAFNPTNRYHYFVDILLDKILNGDFTLNPELLEQIASGKWESPMLALLGGFIYLNGTEKKNDGLFAIIVRNLQQKILTNSKNSPDLWALNLLSYLHFGKTVNEHEKISSGGIPMLRSAFDVMRLAAIQYPFLITEGGINDFVAENQVFDSPFNTFKSLGRNRFIRILRNEDNQGNNNLNMAGTLQEIDDRDVGRGKFEVISKKFGEATNLQNLYDNQRGSETNLPDPQGKSNQQAKLIRLLKRRNKISRTATAIVNFLLRADVFHQNNDVAAALQIPVNTVARIRGTYKI
jgi:hypothetical protein